MEATMLRRRTGLGCGLGILLCLTALAACKCGEEGAGTGTGPAPGAKDFESTVGKLPSAALVQVAGLLPAEAQVAVLSDRPEKVMAWLEARPWWQALRASPVWVDLSLSGPLRQLSTLRHRVAAASPVPLQQPSLSELLVGPVGLAVRWDGSQVAFLAVKAVDLKVQSLERLVEAFAQARAGELVQTVEAGGFSIRSVELAPGQAMHYHLFSNLLLVSNDQDMLTEALARAAGKPDAKPGLAKDADRGGLLQAAADPDLLVLLSPEELGGLWALALPLPAAALGWRLEPSPKLEFRAPAGEGAEQLSKELLPASAGLLPLESRLVLGRAQVNIAGLWAALAEAAPEGEGEGEGKRAALPAAPESLGGEGVLVLTGLEGGPAGPRLHAALLVPASDPKAAGEFAAAALEGAFGQPPTEEAGAPGGKRLWLAQGAEEPWSPACAVLDGWLVCGTTADAVRKVMATAAGQAPALRDVPGLKDKLLGEGAPAYGLGYLDAAGLSQDLLALLRSGVALGERFDANDVDDTLKPFLEAVGQLGRLGGALWARPPVIQGSVVPL
jgi:hypothetical protein